MLSADTRKSKNMSERIWVTWETQRRNRTLSKELRAKIYEFDYRINIMSRYILSIIKTLKIFVSEKPKVIFVQNPSLVLALLAVLYGKLVKVPIVVDAHNAGLSPVRGPTAIVNGIALQIIKLASLTIVTNYALKNYVETQGGKAFVLPDPTPSLIPTKKLLKLRGKYNVLFICTYANDEPYLEVINAARLIAEEIVIYISGNPRGKEKELIKNLPNNVILTGYLSEEEFIDMLFSVDVVLDLTTRDDCLVCGAYEGIAVEKPIILSDTIALREYFNKGALFVDNTARDISNKICFAIKQKQGLTKETAVLKEQLVRARGETLNDLEKLLTDLTKSEKTK